jgi:mono/diheme cytochrome c family protein
MKYNTKLVTPSLAIILALVITISCTHEDNPVPAPPVPPYEAAELSVGGIMYDKFWATESGFDQSDPNFSTLDNNANFFRCKQCHAWDGLGNSGSYINRAPSTTRPNVSSLDLYGIAQAKTADELFEAMKSTENRRDITYDLSQYDPASNATEGDKMPDYSQILTDAEIWNIVKYMKEGMFDVSKLYVANYGGSYPTGTASYFSLGLDGNADNGNAYYAANCASCHGATGIDIDLGGKALGGFTRSKPYEVQHKTKYGALGVTPPMVGEFDISLEEMKDLLKAFSSTSNFPTNIPDLGPVFFAADIEPIFYTGDKCTYCHKPGGVKESLNLTQGNAYASIVDVNGFVNLTAPESSIIYTKPQGSHAVNYTSLESSKILKWIEAGAKND